MGVNEGVVDHFSNLIIRQLLDLHDLVRRAKAVEYVQKRNSRSESCSLGYEGQVHGLLYGCGKQHRPASRPDCHHVAVISEYRQCMGCYGSCCDMKYRA